MLEVKGLNSWYGESHVLHGVDFEVREGEVVTLLGRNGAGKSTTLKSIMGLVPRRTGSIRFRAAETIGFEPKEVARAGIAFCPEERGIFASLTVAENLTLPPVLRPGGLDLETIFSLFPNLKERSSSPGTKLSGGEQQMLAIARGLMARPKLLMLDEPSWGIAPKFVTKVLDVIQQVNQTGVSILLVEQNLQKALNIAHYGYVIQTGRIVMQGTGQELLGDERVKKAYLGL